MSRITYCGTWVATCLGLVAVSHLHPPHIIPRNSSAPPGLYLARDLPLTRGTWVAVCPPAAGSRLGLRRGYLSPGTCPEGSARSLKRIAAVPGDVVEVGADGLRVNGEQVESGRPLEQDRSGRPLVPMPRGCYPVRPQEFWVLSTYSQYSYDSRYYGPVTFDRIEETLTPVWTFP